MRRLYWLVVAALAGAGAAQAQEAGTGPRGVGPLIRVVAGALNPDAIEKATMALGVEAGVAWRGRTMLVARALRQSQNRNSGADLSHEARDLFSVLLEHTFGPDVLRRREYLVRIGAGVMHRPHFPDAAVATLGLGVRYPVYRSVTLVGTLEDDLAALPAGSYSYSYWDPMLMTTIYTTVNARKMLQSNFGFLLSLEWRP